MLLEVNNQTVAGLTLYDLNTIISRAEDPVRLKSVREGNQIMKELRRYLSMKTEKGIFEIDENCCRWKSEAGLLWRFRALGVY